MPGDNLDYDSKLMFGQYNTLTYSFDYAKSLTSHFATGGASAYLKHFKIEDCVIYIGGGIDTGRVTQQSETPAWAPLIIALKGDDYSVKQAVHILPEGVTYSDPADFPTVTHMQVDKDALIWYT